MGVSGVDGQGLPDEVSLDEDCDFFGPLVKNASSVLKLKGSGFLAFRPL